MKIFLNIFIFKIFFILFWSVNSIAATRRVCENSRNNNKDVMVTTKKTIIWNNDINEYVLQSNDDRGTNIKGKFKIGDSWGLHEENGSWIAYNLFTGEVVKGSGGIRKRFFCKTYKIN